MADGVRFGDNVATGMEKRANDSALAFVEKISAECVNLRGVGPCPAK